MSRQRTSVTHGGVTTGEPFTGAASYSPGIALELNAALYTQVGTYNAAEGDGRCH